MISEPDRLARPAYPGGRTRGPGTKLVGRARAFFRAVAVLLRSPAAWSISKSGMSCEAGPATRSSSSTRWRPHRSVWRAAYSPGVSATC